MAFRVNVNVKGAEEAARALQEITKRFDPQPVKKAIFPAARIVRDQAARNAPVGTGLTPAGKPRTHLKDAVFAAYGKPRQPDVIAGVDLKKAPHAVLVEDGVKPHRILPKPPHKYLYFNNRKVPYVDHPGTPATHFFARAVRSTRGRVLTAIEDGAKKLLAGLITP